MSRRRKESLSLTGQSPPRHPLQHVPLSPGARQALSACLGPGAPPELFERARRLVLLLGPIPLKTQAQVLEAFAHAPADQVLRTLGAVLRLGQDHRSRFGELAMLSAAFARNLPLLEALIAEPGRCLLSPDLLRGQPLLSHLAKLAQEPTCHVSVQEAAHACLFPSRQDGSPSAEGAPPWAASVMAGLALHHPGELGRLWRGLTDHKGQTRTAGEAPWKLDVPAGAARPPPSRTLVEASIARLGSTPARSLQALTGFPYVEWRGSDAGHRQSALGLLERLAAAEVAAPVLVQPAEEAPFLFLSIKEGELLLFGWTSGEQGPMRTEIAVTAAALSNVPLALHVPQTVLEHHQSGKALPSLARQQDPALRWFLT